MGERPRGEHVKSEEEIDREKRSKVLLRFFRSAENIEPLHGRTIEEVFSTEEEKRGFIQSLETDEFIELLNGINGILRDKEQAGWEMDGENVLVTSLLGQPYLPPRQEDKAGLLADVLERTKEMDRRDQDFKDIALLVSSTLNAIHPYLDANGRTSRLLYLFLTKNFNNETQEELVAVLGSEGRHEFDINPGLIGHEITEVIIKEIGASNDDINSERMQTFWGSFPDLQFSERISEKDQALFLHLLKNDKMYLFFAVFQYLQDKEDRDQYLRKYPEHSVILLDILSKNLDQGALDQILQNYKDLKKRYVEVLIDSIADSKNDKYQIEHDGERISLKDLFVLRMKERAEKSNEEED